MNATPESVKAALDVNYSVTPAQVKYFSENGFIKIKNIFDASVIDYMNIVISKEVDRLNNQQIPLEERDTYGKAFLQLFNLWQEDELVKELIFSKRLGKLASDLMQVEGVRLYHDQALFKEGGGGITPWHADQYYWPLETDKTITAWIPLQETPLGLGPLEFSAGSHEIVEGRELEIGDESEVLIQQKLKITDFKQFQNLPSTNEFGLTDGGKFFMKDSTATFTFTNRGEVETLENMLERKTFEEEFINYADGWKHGKKNILFLESIRKQDVTFRDTLSDAGKEWWDNIE